DRLGRLAEQTVDHDVPGVTVACVGLDFAAGAVFQRIVDPADDAVTVRHRATQPREGAHDISQPADRVVAGLHPVRQIHRDVALSGGVDPGIDLQRFGGRLEAAHLD